MKQKRPIIQRSLLLMAENPATLTAQEETDLVRALAELLLAVARNETSAARGGDHEHKDHS